MLRFKERELMARAQVKAAPLQEGGHEPRNAGMLQKLKKTRNKVFSRASHRNAALLHLRFCHVNPFLDF